jgi:predicted lipoprotein
MKKFLPLALGFVLAGAFNSCGTDDSGIDKNTNNYDFTEILADYTDNTVVATYADMKDESKILFSYAEAFGTSGSQSDLDAACAAWRATRVPWEQSESFLFGPANTNSLDPLLDSWPLDQAQLDQVLAGSQTLTADYVRDALGAVLRGFHTIEYLMFRDGNPRTAADVTLREKQYLVAVTEVLRDDCIKLWALWHGAEGMSTEDAALVEALEISAGTGYAYEFKNAGGIGSRYLSQKDAVDEIIQGCLDIADEVANGKIADPYTTKDVLQVESWFSWNSLTDFQNNVRSIQNAFYGGVDAESRSEKCLANLVKTIDAGLEAELNTKLTTAIAAINNIPAPFRNNLDKTAQIEAAMAAVNDLTPVLTEIKGLFE